MKSIIEITIPKNIEGEVVFVKILGKYRREYFM
jgi:hypothetical protein